MNRIEKPHVKILWVILIFAQLPWLDFAQLSLHLASNERTINVSCAQWSKQLQFLCSVQFTIEVCFDIKGSHLFKSKAAFLRLEFVLFFKVERLIRLIIYLHVYCIYCTHFVLFKNHSHQIREKVASSFILFLILLFGRNVLEGRIYDLHSLPLFFSSDFFSLFRHLQNRNPKITKTFSETIGQHYF